VRRGDGTYRTGESVSDASMVTLNLTQHDVCPTWTYTLLPRPTAAPDPAINDAIRERVL